MRIIKSLDEHENHGFSSSLIFLLKAVKMTMPEMLDREKQQQQQESQCSHIPFISLHRNSRFCLWNGVLGIT